MKSAMPAARSGLILLLGVLLAACTEQKSTEDALAWPEEIIPPIPGTTFSLGERHLPGAPRDYRDGTHEGFDFVNGTAGRPLSAQEPVLAVAGGVIVRIDQEYTDPDRETLEYWADQTTRQGFLGDYALDQLRGRQVWIRHDSGHISRYAHLSAVHPELAPGDEVEQGQAVGQTGTTGLLPAADGQEPVAHLHFELWTPDGARHLCQGLEPLDCHRQLRRTFGEAALPRHAREVLAAMDAGEPAPETWPPEPLPDTGFSVTPPSAVSTGTAIAVPATWEGDAFRPGDFYGLLQGHPMGVIDAGDGAWLLGAMPLEFEGEQATLVAGASDAYGQSLVGRRNFQVKPLADIPSPAQVPESVMDLYTEDNLEAEREPVYRAALQALQHKEARWKAPFRPPLEGDVLRQFGQEAFYGMLRPAHPLPGITISAEAGAPVAAANDGVVALAGELPIRGRTVIIDHGGGVTSVYAHLAEIGVSQDNRVERGQTLGRAGQSGAAARPQVRWEVHVAGLPTNPLDWAGSILPNRQEPAG